MHGEEWSRLLDASLCSTFNFAANQSIKIKGYNKNHPVDRTGGTRKVTDVMMFLLGNLFSKPAFRYCRVDSGYTPGVKC